MSASVIYQEVSRMISEASERYGEGYMLSGEKYAHLQEVCDTLTDIAYDEGEAVLYGYVDDRCKQLAITVEFVSVEFCGKKKDDFGKIMVYTDGVEMAATTTIDLRLTLYINGLWESRYQK